jgi:hypothetical protein
MLGKRFRIGVIDILAVMGGSLLAAPFVLMIVAPFLGAI